MSVLELKYSPAIINQSQVSMMLDDIRYDVTSQQCEGRLECMMGLCMERGVTKESLMAVTNKLCLIMGKGTQSFLMDVGRRSELIQQSEPSASK